MSDRLVTVAAFPTGPEANLVRNVLEAEGIRCVVADETAVGMLWQLGASLPGVGVQVPEEDAERARQILAQYQAASAGVEGASPAPFFPESDEDLEVEPTAPGDEAALRAWRAAVIGIGLCPPLLHFYSGFLLILIAVRNQPLSPKGTRRFYGAMFFDLLAAAACGFLINLLK